MAGYELIDTYVATLRRRLAFRPDADDVVAEAEDHLISAVDGLMAEGCDRQSAQEAALDRFGDPGSVAMAFAATSTGGLAIPTRFTRRAGIAAIVAAGLWATAAVLWLLDELIGVSDGDNAAALLGMASLLGAAGLTAVLVVGLIRRHGGLGHLGTIGLTLIGLGAVATLMFWFVMGWGTLLAAGMLLVAIAVHSRRLAPTAATVAFGAAWTVGVVTWSALRLLEVGTRDEWGDYPIVAPTAVAVGVFILVPGLVGLGRWLSRETPVDLETPESLAAA